MSTNLFAKAVQDAASGSEDGQGVFRGTCHEVFINWRIKLNWDVISN